jgi:hypothetical protein
VCCFWLRGYEGLRQTAARHGPGKVRVLIGSPPMISRIAVDRDLYQRSFETITIQLRWFSGDS